MKDSFQDNDEIVSLNGEKVESHAQLQILLARFRASSVKLGIQRGDKVETVTIEPARFREVGLWMDIEQIAAVQENSPASKAGLKVGDKITSVNGVDVGKDINPLHLAEHLEIFTGEEVEIRVK